MGFTWLKAQLLRGCKGYKSITAMPQKKFFIRDEILSSLGKFVFFERFILPKKFYCHSFKLIRNAAISCITILHILSLLSVSCRHCYHWFGNGNNTIIKQGGNETLAGLKF